MNCHKNYFLVKTGEGGEEGRGRRGGGRGWVGDLRTRMRGEGGEDTSCE